MTTEQWEHARVAAEAVGMEAHSGVLLADGRINDNFLLQTSQGSVLLRVYPQTRSPRQIGFELSLLDHLSRAQCRVPRPLLGSTVGQFAERPCAWMQALDASPLAAHSCWQMPVADLGALLVPIFQSLAKCTPPFRPVPESRTFAAWIPSLFLALEAAQMGAERKRCEQILKQCQEKEGQAPLPSGIVHADIRPENLLRDHSTKALYLVDFDSAHVGPRMVDWVGCALEFSDPEQSTSSRRFADILEALLPADVSPEESAALPWMTELLVLKTATFEVSLGRDPRTCPALLRLFR